MIGADISRPYLQILADWLGVLVGGSTNGGRGWKPGGGILEEEEMDCGA